MSAAVAFCLAAMSLARPAAACTSFLVTKGASADGSTMITYAGDSHTRYGDIAIIPRGRWAKGDSIEVRDRSSLRLLGRIPQPAETYQVVGFMNEHQVSIGESTFGGRPGLADSTGVIDWGSAMFLALQRARTAREAVKVMVELFEAYGFYSDGESYSIADPHEAWILEVVGKGVDLRPQRRGPARNANRGAVWVARRVPDGYVSAHANQARIAAFDREDGRRSISSRDLDKIFLPDIETVYAHDVVSFARQRGFFAGPDSLFSFCDAYNPLSFSGQRFCEIRVWAFFDQFCGDMSAYWDYATGKAGARRMPLFVRPERKLSVWDLCQAQANHLQGTPLDMSRGVGAGPQGLPYRWRPMTWQIDGREYLHERATATQQTAFSFVAQMRSWLPAPVGGVLWFGVDDANLTVRAPLYCGVERVPGTMAQGNGDLLTYSDSAAFWVFSRVAHFAYLFYGSVIDQVRDKQLALHQDFERRLPAVDSAAAALLASDPAAARRLLTDFSCPAADSMVMAWRDFGNYLLVKYLDGNVKRESDGDFERNAHGFPVSPRHPAHREEWLRAIVGAEGGTLAVPAE